MLQHLQAFEHEECAKEHAFELERLRLNVQLLEAQLKQKKEQQNLERYQLDLIKDGKLSDTSPK